MSLLRRYECVRSGNPDAFFAGDAAALHYRAVDTINWSPDPAEEGLLHIHQMGHVGGYYDQRPEGSVGSVGSGGAVCHSPVEGLFEHHFLTGDPRSLEVAMMITDTGPTASFRSPTTATTRCAPPAGT